MNIVQLSLLAAFLVALVAVYWTQIATFVRSAGRISHTPKSSIAVNLVGDLLAITELRDKLSAENYQEGVDACTVLLRVIVEHTRKTNNTTKGAV
jgi:hypothetical protein